MSDPFLVGVLYGFVPAMGFLYILLHNYQPFFDEKRIFKSFLLGFVVGFFVTLLEVVLGPGRTLNPDDPNALPLWGVALFSLLYGVLEVMAASAVLNWRTFRGRGNTPFYGAAMGLGFGAANTLFLVGGRVQALSGGSTGIPEVLVLSLLGLYFIGSILVHAGAFVWVGQGAAKAQLPKYGAYGALALAGYLFLFLGLPHIPASLANAVPVLAAVVAVAFIAWILRRVLDRIVPEEVLREAGIHRRRIARKRLREEVGAEDAEAPGPDLKE